MGFQMEISTLELLQSGGAITGVVSSALFLVYGAWSSFSSYLQGAQLWDGVGLMFLGALGFIDVAQNASKQDPDWEYTMEDIEMEASLPVTPQALMDDSILTSTLVTPALKDLISKLKK